MIGGAMLACAVGAMLLIARWSLERDDEDNPATGLLALRMPHQRNETDAGEGRRSSRKRRPRSPQNPDYPPGTRLKANGKRDRRPDPVTRRRRRRP